jgi:hypothetical protein
MAGWLAERGIFDGGIVAEALGRMTSSPDERRDLTAYKQQLMTDREFVEKFLAGDAAAVRKMTLVDIILSKPHAT